MLKGTFIESFGCFISVIITHAAIQFDDIVYVARHLRASFGSRRAPARSFTPQALTVDNEQSRGVCGRPDRTELQME